MAQYQVRGWNGWHQHIAMVTLAMLFALQQKVAYRDRVPLLSTHDIVELLSWAPLKTYQDRDEYNFDFEQGDSVHRRAGSPSCADQRSSEPKVFRFERLAACCALAALLSPRQGFQPNRWRESLACITANRQSRHMGGFQRCPNGIIFSNSSCLPEISFGSFNLEAW